MSSECSDSEPRRKNAVAAAWMWYRETRPTDRDDDHYRYSFDNNNERRRPSRRLPRPWSRNTSHGPDHIGNEHDTDADDDDDDVGTEFATDSVSRAIMIACYR